MTPPNGLCKRWPKIRQQICMKWSHNCKKHDFPRKEKVDTNANGCIPTDWKTILTKEHIEDAGKVYGRLPLWGLHITV